MAFTIDLTNRCALVTGVSSGIGAGIAACLAQAGCDVAGCGIEPIDHAGVRAFLRTVQSFGRRAFYTSLDIAITESISGWVTTAAQQLGHIDYVISNAGRNIFTGVEQCDEETWAQNINVNLGSHWRVIKAAKPYLNQSEAGVVIVISSNHALYSMPGCFPYNMAKAGLLGLVQSVALEWGPHIRAVGIMPGFVNTPNNDKWFNSFADPSAQRAKIYDIHPVKRIGNPEDIGALCVFLCSSHAGYITGTTILVDGGRGALMQD